MSYELKAILEYDAARLEIKELGRRIAEEMGKECLNPTTALTLESYLPIQVFGLACLYTGCELHQKPVDILNSY